MEKRGLGKTGFEISAVSYGGIISASHYSQFSFEGDGQKASDYFVSWAVDQGVNYFDVAPAYGDAQNMLGNSLRPYRNRIYLACKTEQRKKDGAEKACGSP